ncbi:MAG: hypothetical protein LBI43_03730 [Streptococcaceae bacterium]|jgi:addiction module RelB/DinJ family antitoxin|nr:hypothetical protein [Streptococcaceae bacterium]
MNPNAKNTQVSFRSNADIVAKAKEIFRANNIDMTLALNHFLARTVEENALPFAVYDEEAERVYAELKTEIGKAFKSLEAGDFVDASEVEAKWNES